MAPKKPTVKTRLQQKADKSNKILTGPKGSKPQSTTNNRLLKQGDKPKIGSQNVTVKPSFPVRSGPESTMKRTRFQNPSKGGSTTKSQTVGGGGGGTPSGGGRNLFGGAGDKNTAIKQAGPKSPKPAFKPAKAPFSSPPAVGKTAQDLAKTQGQAAVKAAQQRRANLAKVQKDLRGQVSKAGAMFGGLRGGAYQAIAESVAPRPTSMRAGLKAGQAAAAARAKAKGKSADSFGGQYQKGKAAPSKAPKGQTKAKSFDNAFASARNSGMKTFVWEGKRYTTKMK